MNKKCINIFLKNNILLLEFLNFEFYIKKYFILIKKTFLFDFKYFLSKYLILSQF